jgi:hypothetical protein
LLKFCHFFQTLRNIIVNIELDFTNVIYRYSNHDFLRSGDKLFSGNRYRERPAHPRRDGIITHRHGDVGTLIVFSPTPMGPIPISMVASDDVFQRELKPGIGVLSKPMTCSLASRKDWIMGAPWSVI